jgi:hypothetical protein
MKDLETKISDIELAKAISALRGIPDTKKEFDSLVNHFVKPELQPRVHQIISGLSQEDEFAMFCKVTGTCLSISKIGQTPIIEDMQEKAPDFLASFAIGYTLAGLSPKNSGKILNCFVEVKSCSKIKFSISQKDLSARLRFAERFNIPLIIAVRFTVFKQHTYWILEDASVLEKKGRKILVEDYINSLSSIIFDDYMLVPHPHLYIVERFRKNSQSGGIQHNKYGTLIDMYLVIPNSEPTQIPVEHITLITLFFKSFERTEDFKELDNDCIVVSTIQNQGRFINDIAYSSNYSVRDDDGNIAYDAGRTLARLDLKKPSGLITRRLIEIAISIINQSQMYIFPFGIGDKDSQLNKIKNL